MRADPASHTQGKLDAAVAKLKELNAKKQMLMYGHVDLPTENFSFKSESAAPQCEDGCAFQDKVFTVEVSACEKMHAFTLPALESRGASAKCSIQPACTACGPFLRHPESIFCSSRSSSGDTCVLCMCDG